MGQVNAIPNAPEPVEGKDQGHAANCASAKPPQNFAPFYPGGSLRVGRLYGLDLADKIDVLKLFVATNRQIFEEFDDGSTAPR